MIGDQCALERGLANGEPGNCQPSGTEAGVTVGCVPDLYAALAGSPPDQMITLQARANFHYCLARSVGNQELLETDGFRMDGADGCWIKAPTDFIVPVKLPGHLTVH